MDILSIMSNVDIKIVFSCILMSICIHLVRHIHRYKIVALQNIYVRLASAILSNNFLQ